jgi:SAM-dependent methyltransferase
MKDEENVINITRNTYDRIATGYAVKIHRLIADSWVGEFEQGLLDKFLLMTMLSHPKVLDIGCGNGKDTGYLITKGASVVAMDFSSGMLGEARSHVQNGLLCRMDMRNLAFANEVFDGVWANGCIYHVPKVEVVHVLKDIMRVLRPLGIFSFNVKTGSGERLEDSPRSFSGGPRFYAYYTISEMKKLLKGAGFAVLETKNYPQRIFDEEIFHIWARKPN